MDVHFDHRWVHDDREVPKECNDVLQTFERYDASAKLTRSQRSAVDHFMGKQPDSKILPFFDQARFTANDVLALRNANPYTITPLDNRVYNRIKPALRLASVLLLRHLPLWYLILYGTEIEDPITGKKKLDQENFTARVYHQREFEKVDLPEMQRMTSIGWYRRTSNVQVGLSTMAWSAPASHPQNPELRLLLSCASYYWAPFQLNSGWDQLIHEERCTHWVHFAITMMHEFAHCLMFYRHRAKHEADAIQRNSYPRFGPDALLKTWPEEEVGYAVEVAALGGVMDLCSFNDPENWKFLPSIFAYKGTVIPRMRLLNYPYDDVNDHYHADIAPATMVALMQENTWKDSWGDQPVKIYLWQRLTRRP